MIIKSVTIYVKPENINEFIEATIENQQNSRKEKEIQCFDFFQCKDDPAKFLLYEVYQSQEGIDAHLKSEHFKKWIGTVEHYFSSPSDRATYIPVNSMNYQIRETNSKKYIELFSTANPLNTENDALDLIALCSEVDTNLLMLHFPTFSEDFFNLKTGVAGKIIQKFVNYRVKVAAIVPDEITSQGKFKDMAIEANRNNHFRIYGNKMDAEKWILE